LIDIAQTLSLALTGSRDLVARFGGEEFVVILPGVDASGAYKVAKRCQRLVERLAITHAHSPHQQRVTLSIGVESMQPLAGGTAAELLQAVDRQLYAAKQRGRNRIEMASVAA